MGEIGIARHEFLYELKLWEINSIVEGYRRRSHTTWESTRWQTFLLLCALGAKNIHHPDDIVKFPWEIKDAEGDDDTMTEEDVIAMQEEIAMINQRLKLSREKDNADNSPLH